MSFCILYWTGCLSLLIRYSFLETYSAAVTIDGAGCLASDVCCLNQDPNAYADYLEDQEATWPIVSDLSFRHGLYNIAVFTCFRVKSSAYSTLGRRQQFRHYLKCPVSTDLWIIDGLLLKAQKRHVKKAFCIAPVVDGAELVIYDLGHVCLDLPMMTRKQGILAWTTKVRQYHHESEGVYVEEAAVQYLSINRVRHSLRLHSFIILEADYNSKALEWHPGSSAPSKGDRYQACIRNEVDEVLKLHVALIDTWPE